MKLHVDWDGPIPMSLASGQGAAYTVDLERVPTVAGIYVIARGWSDGFEALYVGKALNIRRRIKGQLNNLRLMQHVETASTGKRCVFAGMVDRRAGQEIGKAIAVTERAFIRHFLSEGHDLVNISGTSLRQHEVESTHRPMKFVPQRIYVDKGRGPR